MKTLLGMTAAATVLAAGTTLKMNQEICHNWGLSPTEITACETRMKAARSDVEVAKVREQFDPNFPHTSGTVISPAQDAKESLGSGAVRNTGATGTTGTNLATVTRRDSSKAKDLSEDIQQKTK